MSELFTHNFKLGAWGMGGLCGKNVDSHLIDNILHDFELFDTFNDFGIMKV
jgi:hypothetical protein